MANEVRNEDEVDPEDIHKVKTIQNQSTCGFIGMEYYREGDAALFKGRDDEIEKLQRLVFGRITLLFGKSGIGKSSLIHAGLLPALKRYGWECIVTRPDVRKGTFFRANDITLLLDFSGKDDEKLEALYPLLTQRMPGKDILIAIDQFEDVTIFGDAMFDDIAKALFPIYANRFPKIHLLISYRDDAEGKLGRLWQKVTKSAKGRLPRYYLKPLTLEASEVFFPTFERLGIRYFPPTLIKDTILPELEAESRQQTGENIYPPYLQIVGIKLLELAEATNDMIVTKDAYHDAGGAKRMIGMYLLDSLGELENRSLNSEDGKKILIALTRSSGGKKPCTLEELVAECKIAEDSLQKLLRELINLRIIQHIGREFEIAHDYLVFLVCENITIDERQYKAVRELLSGKAWRYPKTGVLLNSDELQILYGFRERVRPNEKESALLFRSCIQREGIGWYWFRNCPQTTLLQYARQCIDDKNRGVRRSAINVIGKLGTAEDLPLLKKFLPDEDEDVREIAIKVIGNLGTAEDLPLLKQCLPDEYLNVCEVAIGAISKLATVDDLPLLKQCLNGDLVDDLVRPFLSEDARQAAIEAIGKLSIEAIGKLRSVDDLPLLKKWLSDEYFMREAAIEAIGKLGAADYLPSLKQCLSDENQDVCIAAIKAIGNLGTAEDLPSLRKCLSDENPDVRIAAIKAIGNLGTAEDLPFLKQCLSDDNRYVRRTTIEVIGKLATADDLPFLKQCLSDEDSDVRRTAIEAIGKIGTADDLPFLKQCLSDEYHNVRGAAIEAIGNLGTAEDLPLLKKCLINDISSDVGKAAIEAIGKLATTDDLPLLKQWLSDKYIVVRKAAIEAIGKLGTADVLPALKQCLSDEYPYVRRDAIEAISKLETSENLPSLLKQWLGDESQIVRKAVIKVISKLAPADGLSQLKQCLISDKGSDVGEAAIKAIGKLATTDDLPLLKQWLSDEDLYVRRTAIKTIGKLATANDLPSLKQCLSDEEKDIRRAATLNIIRLADKEELLSLMEDAMSLPFDVLQMLDEYLFCPSELWSEDLREAIGCRSN